MCSLVTVHCACPASLFAASEHPLSVVMPACEAHHCSSMMAGEDAASLHDADSSLAQLSITEEACCSPSQSAADDGRVGGQLQHSNGPPPATTATQSMQDLDTGKARRPPLHLVNVRRRPSQGGGGRNIVNVYTRDGE